MSKLDLLLKDFYQGESLSQEQIGVIKDSSKSDKASKTPNKNARSIVNLISKSQQQPPSKNWLRQCAIVFSLVAILSSITVHYFNANYQKHLVVNEIVLNHQKTFKADVIDSNFMNLSAALSGANFDIKVPEHIRSQFNLLGARYCSISNQLAIHIQLADKISSKTSSLFITPTSKKLRNIENDVELATQRKAHYWSNESLFYALLN